MPKRTGHQNTPKCTTILISPTFSVTDTAKLYLPQERALPYLPCWPLFKHLFHYLGWFGDAGRPLSVKKSIHRWWMLCICNISASLKMDVVSWRACSSDTTCWLGYYFLSVVVFMHHYETLTFLSTRLKEEAVRSVLIFCWVTVHCHPSCIFPLPNKQIIRHFSSSFH